MSDLINSSPMSNHSFDSPDADIIIISSSCEPAPRKFHLHSTILSLASPFFEHMFSLPQTHQKEVPVLPVSEPAATLETLFRFVYPGIDPAVEDLDELSAVLEAAVKYDFLSTIRHLRRILVEPRWLKDFPIRVFAIAWRYDFNSEVKLASQHTLNIDILNLPLTNDLKHITAHTYQRLLNLHRDRAREAQDLLKLPYDIHCSHCNTYGHARYNAPKWWREWTRKAKEELAARPTTSVIFEMGFMFQAAADAGCPGCPSNMLDSLGHLEKIKICIDALPCTLT